MFKELEKQIETFKISYSEIISEIKVEYKFKQTDDLSALVCLKDIEGFSYDFEVVLHENEAHILLPLDKGKTPLLPYGFIIYQQIDLMEVRSNEEIRKVFEKTEEIEQEDVWIRCMECDIEFLSRDLRYDYNGRRVCVDCISNLEIPS